MSRSAFVPPFLLDRIARSHADPAVRRAGEQTLLLDADVRTRREAGALHTDPRAVDTGTDTGTGTGTGTGNWTVYDAGNGTGLPGEKARATGEPAGDDAAVNEAYDGVQASMALFGGVFGRSSFDDAGAEVTATVHYGKDYDNAFWDGEQLVFGDGDGKVFVRFTAALDVVAHEFSHAVVQYTANLTYQDQSGALNESLCDVFASCVKQRVLGQQADEADWLVGKGIFTDQVQGRALRSMAEPGTAYDDDVLGKDPQVGSMDAYVDTTDDNGGVHINSGIPNRAFYLAATALGGSSWEGAGPIWYAALTSGIGAETDFAAFARATVAAAADVSPEAEQAVGQAWSTVGVAGDGGVAQDEPAGPRTGSVVVRRTGGFAGIQSSGEVLLGEDPRSREVESLLGGIDLRALPASPPQPDRFGYVFVIDGHAVQVAEQDLTPELGELARLVLGG